MVKKSEDFIKNNFSAILIILQFAIFAGWYFKEYKDMVVDVKFIKAEIVDYKILREKDYGEHRIMDVRITANSKAIEDLEDAVNRR